MRRRTSSQRLRDEGAIVFYSSDIVNQDVVEIFRAEGRGWSSDLCECGVMYHQEVERYRCSLYDEMNLLMEEKRVEAKIELKERRWFILHIQSPSLPQLGVPQNLALELPQAFLLCIVQLTLQHPSRI